MSSLLKKFLLKTKGPDGASLFKSGSQIAKKIADLEYLSHIERENPYYARELSLASYLNQVFRGERAISDNLKDALSEVLVRRLSGETESVQKEWVSRLYQAIDGAKLMYQGIKSGDPDLLLDLALQRALSARENFIICTRSNDGLDLAPFRELLIRRLGLDDDQEEGPTASYTFCDPSEDQSRQGWRYLFNHVVGLDTEDLLTRPPMDPTLAADRLDALDRSDKLRLFALPRAMASLPLLVFDPMSRNPVAFIPFFNAQENVENPLDLKLVPPNAVEDWKKDFYEPFIYGQIGAKRVRFEEVRTEVVEMAEVRLRMIADQFPEGAKAPDRSEPAKVEAAPQSEGQTEPASPGTTRVG